MVGWELSRGAWGSREWRGEEAGSGSVHYAPSLEVGSISLGPGGCSGILSLL